MPGESGGNSRIRGRPDPPMSPSMGMVALCEAVAILKRLHGILVLAGAVVLPPVFLAGCAAGPGPAPGAETVRVAGIVLKWIRGDKEANWRRAEPLIRLAAARGAKLVVTTECFLDGYAIQDKSIPLDVYRALGERIPGGACFRRLAALADELDIHLVAGMLEAAGDERHNTAVLLGPDGRLLGRYRKQFLEHESVRNAPGDECPAFETPWGRAGILICADRRKPEIARDICRNGAVFIIIPSGGMFGPKTNDPIVQARSRENGVPIVFVHPVEFLVTGRDGSILTRTLLGDRLLIPPAGEGGPEDLNGAILFDLPLKKAAGAR